MEKVEAGVSVVFFSSCGVRFKEISERWQRDKKFVLILSSSNKPSGNRRISVLGLGHDEDETPQTYTELAASKAPVRHPGLLPGETPLKSHSEHTIKSLPSTQDRRGSAQSAAVTGRRGSVQQNTSRRGSAAPIAGAAAQKPSWVG
jgi:hypothetical protein